MLNTTVSPIHADRNITDEVLTFFHPSSILEGGCHELKRFVRCFPKVI